MKKIFVSMLLVLGFSLGAYANDNTPEGVILAYQEAVKKGNLEKAKSYLDEKSFYRTNYKTGARVDNKNQMLGEHYNGLKNGGDISQWTFKAEKNDDKLSTANYKLYSTNPTSEFEDIRNGTYYRLVSIEKINGKWKIVRMT